MKAIDSGEELVFATSSSGGISALGRLCNSYGNRLAMGSSGVPVIELAASGYRHKRFGLVDVPVFKVVAWHSEQDLIAGNAQSLTGELNDELPY